MVNPVTSEHWFVVNTGAIRKSYKRVSAVDCAPNRHTGCTFKLQKILCFSLIPFPLCFIIFYPFLAQRSWEMAHYKTSLFYWIFTLLTQGQTLELFVRTLPWSMELSGLPTAGLLHMRDQEGTATIPVTHMPRHWKALGVFGVRGVG